jgi:hypothetical protein
MFGKLAAVLGGRLCVLSLCPVVHPLITSQLPLNYLLITLNYRLMFGKLAAVLGGRLRVPVSGGALLNYFLITA